MPRSEGSFPGHVRLDYRSLVQSNTAHRWSTQVIGIVSCYWAVHHIVPSNSHAFSKTNGHCTSTDIFCVGVGWYPRRRLRMGQRHWSDRLSRSCSINRQGLSVFLTLKKRLVHGTPQPWDVSISDRSYASMVNWHWYRLPNMLDAERITKVGRMAPKAGVRIYRILDNHDLSNHHARRSIDKLSIIYLQITTSLHHGSYIQHDIHDRPRFGRFQKSFDH